MAKKKFYVVWVGRETGVFESWEECNAQIVRFPNAQYKSFKTKQLAEQAFNSPSVHALAYCKQRNLKLPIYSDSKNAINWVKDKEVRTKHPRSENNVKLFELMDRAIKWLNDNQYDNKILKWETKAWGENPADFGRK